MSDLERNFFSGDKPDSRNLSTSDLKRAYFLNASGSSGGSEGGEGSGASIRIDNSVGTRVFAGNILIYGDTGWRALCRWANGAVTEGTAPSGLGPVGNTAGGIFLRRVTNTVSLAVVEGKALVSNPQISPAPMGFRGNSKVPYPAVPIYYRTEEGTEHVGNIDIGASLYRFRVPANAILASLGTGGYGVQASWLTDTAWPTSLPGVAA